MVDYFPNLVSYINVDPKKQTIFEKLITPTSFESPKRLLIIVKWIWSSVIMTTNKATFVFTGFTLNCALKIDPGNHRSI